MPIHLSIYWHYTLLEQNVAYVYVDETAETGLYKYSYSGGKYVFSDTKLYGVKYY